MAEISEWRDMDGRKRKRAKSAVKKAVYFVSEDIQRRVRVEATRRGISTGCLITEAVEKYIPQQKGN